MKSTVQINPLQATPSQEESEISLFEVFHTLWFRRRLLLSTALFIIAVGTIILFQQPLRYVATSSVLIGLPKSQIVDIESIIAGMATGYNRDITSEIEVLRSREIAQKMVDKFDLVSSAEFNPTLKPPGLLSYFNPVRYFPESWLIRPQTVDDSGKVPVPSLKDYVSDAWKLALGKPPPEPMTAEAREQQRNAIATSLFLSKLSVTKVGYSNVINIGFESLDRNLVAGVANEIPESYIIGQMEAKLSATQKATTWLTDQLEELKIKVETSEQAVELYREQYDITEVRGSEIVTEQLAAVNGQLVIARVERAQLEARARQFSKLSNGLSSGLESSSEVSSSSLIQSLREKEAVAQSKLNEYKTVYGAKHPKLVQAKADVASIQRRIKQETSKISGRLKDELDVARIRERSLEASLNELKQATGAQNRESVRLRSLEREAAANRALFETFLGRFKETSSISSMEDDADARVISKALTPGSAAFPKKKRAMMLIVAGAFIFASALVLLIQALSPGMMSPEQLEDQLGLPAIGLIPKVKEMEPSDYILSKPHSSYGEALNSLRTSLILSGPDDEVKTIQITSSVPEEGKSTLALSFARLLARTGKKVILVDADLRRGSLEKKMGLPTHSMGLTDMVMSTEAQFREFVVKDDKSDLLLMPKGGADYVNASDVFSSHRMENIVTFLRKHFDYVIFDSPPVMAVSDARVLGRLVDKTVFVVRWDQTPKKVIKAALDQLKTHGVDIAGCVLQQVNLKRCGNYGYGASGYYYHYGKYGQYYSS